MINNGLDSITSSRESEGGNNNQIWQGLSDPWMQKSGGLLSSNSKMNMASQTSVTLNELSLDQKPFVGSRNPYFAGNFINHEMIYKTIKRLIDVLISGIALIVATPFMAVIAAIIKLESKGPVLFKQVRIGRDRRIMERGNGHLYERRKFNLGGKPFTIYKFRTMRNGVDAYSFRPKQSDDIRLTKVGKVVRKLCLDELPQMWNIFKGEMSLVGPRPEMPNIVQQYGMREAARLSVKPGLTGLWQLYGSRDKMIHENLHYDLEYLRKRSLYLDLKILLRTIPFVFGLNNV